jgi:hypothetical protein
MRSLGLTRCVFDGASGRGNALAGLVEGVIHSASDTGGWTAAATAGGQGDNGKEQEGCDGFHNVGVSLGYSLNTHKQAAQFCRFATFTAE